MVTASPSPRPGRGAQPGCAAAPLLPPVAPRGAGTHRCCPFLCRRWSSSRSLGPGWRRGSCGRGRVQEGCTHGSLPRVPGEPFKGSPWSWALRRGTPARATSPQTPGGLWAGQVRTLAHRSCWPLGSFVLSALRGLREGQGEPGPRDSLAKKPRSFPRSIPKHCWEMEHQGLGTARGAHRTGVVQRCPEPRCGVPGVARGLGAGAGGQQGRGRTPWDPTPSPSPEHQALSVARPPRPPVAQGAQAPGPAPAAGVWGQDVSLLGTEQPPAHSHLLDELLLIQGTGEVSLVPQD